MLEPFPVTKFSDQQELYVQSLINYDKIMKNCMVTAIGAANPFRFTLKMKLTVLLGFLAILGLQANTSYAQSTRLSLDMENATVQNVISTIESQTEFTFFFNSKLVNLNRKLTIKAQKKKIDKVLSLLFEGEEIIYEIDNRKIILKAKDAKKTPILDRKSVV